MQQINRLNWYPKLWNSFSDLPAIESRNKPYRLLFADSVSLNIICPEIYRESLIQDTEC